MEGIISGDNKMTEGELKKRILSGHTYERYITKFGNHRLGILEDELDSVIDEMKKDMPKHYVYTDYTHDFGDPLSIKYEEPTLEDYPQYVHIPDDKEWLDWAKKYFGDNK